MEVRQIKEFLTIDGQFRPPQITEDGKRVTWDDTAGVYRYDTDIYVVSAAREALTNRAELTLSNGSKVYVALGALAWEDSLTSPVLSVFGRTGDVIATAGDYDASEVDNAFNTAVDTLDDITAGTTNVHFTAADEVDHDLNTTARHTHTNSAVLAAITAAGGGIIPSAIQIAAWDAGIAVTDAHIRDVADAALQDAGGITWTYDSGAGTITPAVSLAGFTTDNLPEGTINRYSSIQTVFSINLPSASTVAGRLVGAVAPTNFPTGWVLTADEGDLIITHELNREIASVSVFSKNLLISRQLFGNAAYSGIYQNYLAVYNNVVIESLATIETEITIKLVFA